MAFPAGSIAFQAEPCDKYILGVLEELQVCIEQNES